MRVGSIDHRSWSSQPISEKTVDTFQRCRPMPKDKTKITNPPMEIRTHSAQRWDKTTLLKDAKKDSGEEQDRLETGSTVSTKIQNLRNNKKSSKTRLIRARNQLKDLLDNQRPELALPSKNTVRRAINKVKSESDVIEKIIGRLKETYATSVKKY